MKNVLKVERVMEGNKERIEATKIKLLTTIFPDYHESAYPSKYNGVQFKALIHDSLYNARLLGIQLEAGSYGNMLRRRVMIKDNCIDADALRQKYEELKFHANSLQKVRESDAKYHAEVKAVYDSVIEKLGLDYTKRWSYGIRSDTKTTVKIKGKTDWQGLKLIQETLNQPITVSLDLSVPVEYAKIIYETLAGKK